MPTPSGKYRTWKRSRMISNPATKLDLSLQKLTDPPDWICNLTHLTYLDLSKNNLQLLPDSIGNLHQLTELYLQSNHLIELPEGIGNLIKINFLIIARNNLSKLPDSIGKMVSLKRLRADSCQLTSIPKSIGNLNKLSQLTLNHNQITVLPENIGNLSQLNQLDLKNNRLTSLPESIGQLSRLKELDVSGNQIVELPRSVRDLNNLVKLNINANPLVDLSILQTLKRLKNVTFLDGTLNRRYWTKISEWKSEWIVDESNYKIRHFIIDRLGVDRIINDLANISIPFKLNLNNYLSTGLLPEIDRLSNICELTIDRNNLTTIPAAIGRLFSLNSLNIGNNQLSSLPDISRLKKLEYFYAYNNKLTNITSQLVKLTKLKEIRLERNQISVLSESIGNLVELVSLNLADNRLQKLPDSIDRCNKLKELKLSRNQLSELPETFGHLINLQDLGLQSNHLQELPASLTIQCRKIQYLDLSHNRISKLPETFGNLTKLRYLYLQSNMIQELPASMANLVDLCWINLNLNPIEDLSMFQHLPKLHTLMLFGTNLPRRYRTKFSEWKAEWLLDENNAEIRRRLIERLGYEKICDELGAIAIDTWQEYTLLKIDNIQIVYQGWQEVGREPMMLLKMTCPSTTHIHILRVPPDMTRAEDAIVWVNHGIHPSKFAIQT